MSRFTFEIPEPVCSTLAGRDCTVAATVRPDWRMPAHPDSRPGWVAVVHDTGDGWSPSWERDDECADETLIVGDEGWPFVEDFAYASDWKALGFEVV